MQIYQNKRKFLHQKRLQIPQDRLGSPTWPPSHCFGTPIRLKYRHVKAEACMAERLTPQIPGLEFQGSRLACRVVSLDKELYST